MTNPANEWTLTGFVEHFDFVHKKMPDQRFPEQGVMLGRLCAWWVGDDVVCNCCVSGCVNRTNCAGVMRMLGLFLIEEAGLIDEQAQRDRKCPC